MKIVIDTNVVISGTFFGGFPGRVVEAVAENRIKACASAKALYIVSGDKDLLDLEEYSGVKIITAAEFCNKYLSTL